MGFKLSSTKSATLHNPALLLSFSIKEAAQEINIRNGVSEEQFQSGEIAIMLDNFEPKATTQILEKIEARRGAREVEGC